MNKGHRFIDITGQSFGRLTVISFSEMKNKRAYWLCSCECGKQAVLSGKSLRIGNTRSCGCLRIESISLPKGEAEINSRFLEYKTSAKKRNLVFSINRDQFIALTTNTTCYYCNRESKGIDRLINQIGYEYSNCVSCCKDCNIAKGTKTTSEFLDMIESIYKNMWRNC